MMVYFGRWITAAGTNGPAGRFARDARDTRALAGSRVLSFGQKRKAPLDSEELGRGLQRYARNIFIFSLAPR